jgi:inner membrane protein
MDPITQGLFGGSFALLTKKKQISKSKKVYIYVAGFLTGLLPDADIFIKSENDPLLALEYHRAFTHSLFFTPIGASLAFVVLYYFFKLFKNYDLSKRELFLACFAGYLSHAPLDALTNYGTSLFLPFSDMRVSLNLISVVDPMFTLPIMFLAIWGLSRNSQWLTKALFGWMAFIFCFNFINRNIATHMIEKMAWERGHNIEYLLVKPTLLNGHIWRTVYQANGKYYVDAVHALPWKQVFYQGGNIDVYDHKRDFPEIIEGTTAFNDFKRFSFFSDNLVAKYGNQLTDLRFSPLPQTVKPMWSVSAKADLNEHVNYTMERPTDKVSRDIFMRMLKGEAISDQEINAL